MSIISVTHLFICHTFYIKSFFPPIPSIWCAGIGNSERLTSISMPPSFRHQPSDILTVTEKTPLTLHTDRFTFPLVHHPTDTRTCLPLATETIRTDCPVTHCWNQQGISFTLSQYQTDERFLFGQTWDVNLHRYLDWMCDHIFDISEHVLYTVLIMQLSLDYQQTSLLKSGLEEQILASRGRQRTKVTIMSLALIFF